MFDHPIHKGLMSKALAGRKGKGTDLHIIISGGGEPNAAEEKENDEARKLGLAPEGASHPNEELKDGAPMGGGEPMHDDDEAQDKALIEDEMKKYGLGGRGLKGKSGMMK